MPHKFPKLEPFKSWQEAKRAAEEILEAMADINTLNPLTAMRISGFAIRLQMTADNPPKSKHK